MNLVSILTDWQRRPHHSPSIFKVALAMTWVKQILLRYLTTISHLMTTTIMILILATLDSVVQRVHILITMLHLMTGQKWGQCISWATCHKEEEEKKGKGHESIPTFKSPVVKISALGIPTFSLPISNHYSMLGKWLDKVEITIHTPQPSPHPNFQVTGGENFGSGYTYVSHQELGVYRLIQPIHISSTLPISHK